MVAIEVKDVWLVVAIVSWTVTVLMLTGTLAREAKRILFG